MTDARPAKKAAAANRAAREAALSDDEVRQLEGRRPRRRRKRYTAPANEPRRERTIRGVTYQLVNGGWIRKPGQEETDGDTDD